MAVLMSAATVSPCPIRGRVQSAPGHVRVQSVPAAASASCPWAVHARERDRAANVRVLAVAIRVPILDWPENVRDTVELFPM